MSRTTLNFLLDSALLLVFTALMAAAAIVRFVFPRGEETAGWNIAGYDYDSWCALQFNLIGLLALGILVHLMLHWSWICGVVVTRLARDKRAKVDDGVQTLYGVGLLIVIIHIVGAAIVVAAIQVQKSPSV